MIKHKIAHALNEMISNTKTLSNVPAILAGSIDKIKFTRNAFKEMRPAHEHEGLIAVADELLLFSNAVAREQMNVSAVALKLDAKDDGALEDHAVMFQYQAGNVVFTEISFPGSDEGENLGYVAGESVFIFPLEVNGLRVLASIDGDYILIHVFLSLIHI